MKTLIPCLTALLIASHALAQPAAPSPATTGVPAADASDASYEAAYKADPKSADALYDYTFSLLKLQKYPDAKRVLGEWKAAAPQDTRHAEVGPLIDRLEKEPDPAKRDQVAADWALEQRRAAEKEAQAIKDNMKKLGDALSADASKKETDVAKLTATAEKDGGAKSWMAVSEAQVAKGDFKGALASAEKALKKDPGDVNAVTAVTHLKRYDGKNGDEIRQALQKERLNQLLKTLDK